MNQTAKGGVVDCGREAATIRALPECPECEGFLRLDIPSANGEAAATQFYAPAAVYCITPTTEGMVKEVARVNRPEPVTRWELRALPATASRDDDPIDLP
ncbi:MAG: hypothetical protein KBA95_01775 [Acidobacteria bacterium]|nr:hypothetical protein [Acidobacteriota bacterium]